METKMKAGHQRINIILDEYSMKDIVIYGCGGMGRETAWLIEEINEKEKEWNILGYLDDDIENLDKTFYRYKVIGNIDWIIKNKGCYCIIAIGKSSARKQIAESIKEHCFFPTLVHPDTKINDSIIIGEGTIISANCTLTTDICIGSHVIINVNTSIMHDTKIGNYTNIFIGVNIAGGVIIEDEVEIGSGATVIPYRTIKENSIIGAGSTVIEDIPKNCTAVGIPAKPIKFH